MIALISISRRFWLQGKISVTARVAMCCIFSQLVLCQAPASPAQTTTTTSVPTTEKSSASTVATTDGAITPAKADAVIATASPATTKGPLVSITQETQLVEAPGPTVSPAFGNVLAFAGDRLIISGAVMSKRVGADGQIFT